LIPATSPEQWKNFLAEPDKHWKRGYSAKTLAYCWQEAEGFPESVKRVLSQKPVFRDLEMLFAIPEHQVPLQGGSRSSQNDIWILAGNNEGLVSIAVEGKVSESFGPTIDEWDYTSSPGKQERMTFLCSLLGIEFPLPGNIRYQLIHRTASAILEAKRFHAKHAVMLVHSFSQTDEWFSDYKEFLSLFDLTASVDKTASVGRVSGVMLHFSWVRGKKHYLNK